MPRVSREQSQRNRLAIEEASSRLFREQGLQGVSVAELMAAAGLTHGGFYGHFESKDALAARACAHAFEQSSRRWAKLPTLRAIVDNYLSPRSRDHAGNGCPAAALVTDVARETPDKPVRAAYVEGIKALVNTLARLPHPTDAPTETDYQRALVQMSTLVGALLIARATRTSAVSNDVLAAARAALLGASG